MSMTHNLDKHQKSEEFLGEFKARWMLSRQIEKYRSIEKSAHVGSAAHIAAKTTADQAQKHLDVRRELRKAGL